MHRRREHLDVETDDEGMTVLAVAVEQLTQYDDLCSD